MRVLDLFSGLGGFSQPFKDRGHEVTTLDVNPKFRPDVVADVRKIWYPSLSLHGSYDVVLASPPCNAFSIVRAWRGWPPELERDGLALVSCTFHLIAEMAPTWWVVENPRGRLRRYIGPPRQTVHLCNFGREFMKPTDLWGRWPGGKLKDPRPCAPHNSSPNGIVEIKNMKRRTGAMAQESGWSKEASALRAKLPYGLGEELCRRMEAALESPRPGDRGP